LFLNLSQGNVKYYWNFGDLSVDSINKNTSHQYKNDDTYWANVCLTIIDSFGCNDTICQKIQISKLLYFLFNGFTPGKDGKNDNLKIQYKGGTFNYNLLVYNRWGALVFETLNANVSDESKFWNGNVMNTGPECPSGSYFAIYQLYLNGTNNPPKEIHSVITLLREF
jgi:gliding motility-associated-like protein